MNAENRWLFDVSDLLQVHVICGKCTASFSVPPDKLRRVPPQCVNCGAPLYDANSKEEKALESLKTALDAATRIGGAPFKVKLEFHAPNTNR